MHLLGGAVRRRDHVDIVQHTRRTVVSGDHVRRLSDRGSEADHKAYFYHKNGAVAVLRIDGKKVTKTQEIEVGGLPEAAMFTPDGKYLYVTNYIDQDISILKVNGTKVTNTGKRFKVPGHPGSGRMSPH